MVVLKGLPMPGWRSIVVLVWVILLGWVVLVGLVILTTSVLLLVLIVVLALIHFYSFLFSRLLAITD